MEQGLRQKPTIFKRIKQQWFLLLITVPFIVYIFVFSFYPLYFWRWAFYDYKLVPGAEFIGLAKFQEMFTNIGFWEAIRNTVIISILMLVFSTVGAVLFAVFLNELPKGRFKRVAQTVSYLPHFVSWTVVAGICRALLLENDGVINIMLQNIGLIDEPVPFLASQGWYYPVITIFTIWKETGWNAIIYLAAMTAINSELYDAAYVDGAGRFKRIWHVTLPGIRTTILILTVMNIGWLLGAGYDQALVLSTNLNIAVADVLSFYVARNGLDERNYSLGIAAGAVQSVVSVALLVSVNALSKKLEGASIL